MNTAESLSGARVGAYRIIREIGRGGMGVIYEAQEEALGRDVALKVMRIDPSADPAAPRRFLREAKGLAKMMHPNVPAIYAYGVCDGLTYIACQIVRGENLLSRLERDGVPPLGEALRIGRAVASALDAMHRRGLIHRDVKTSNLMLEDGGEVKLIDFGLARDMCDDARITRTDFFVGTPEYCSPEQLAGQDLDGRADLYSLGVVLYELVTGRLPFSAKTTAILYQRILKTRPTPVRRLRPGTPRLVEHLVERLLAKSPERRMRSAAEAMEEIDAIREGLERADRGTGRPGWSDFFHRILPGERRPRTGTTS